jgi:NAD(P)-dependent dehydrogenase (short-subunit alcohol dehydrogenase family)
MKDLSGKVAVITGAASGIGRGMAEAFVEAGMKVVLSDIEEPALEATTSKLRSAGADVHAVPTDVSKSDQIERLAHETLRKYGAVHVLCNNAGVGVRAASGWESTLDDWSWIVGVNLMSVAYGHRTFLPIMLEQGTEGHIVNTASLAGLLPGGGALYSATKAAVVSLTETTYFELQNRRAKIGMSVLCPGFVDTNILKAERNRPAELSQTVPIQRTVITEVFLEWFEGQLKHGLSPRAAGDQVLAAIRDQRFYVLTHPDWNPLITKRTERIVSGENPGQSIPPGYEKFVEMLQARTAATRT